MNKRNVKGFTLIELVIVIVIIGILAAVAIPRYVDLRDSAATAGSKAMEGAVKAAFAIAIAEKSGQGYTGNSLYPTATELADTYLTGSSVTAVTTGIASTLGDTQYIVQTYGTTNCSGSPVGGTNVVKCVGSVTP